MKSASQILIERARKRISDPCVCDPNTDEWYQKLILDMTSSDLDRCGICNKLVAGYTNKEWIQYWEDKGWKRIQCHTCGGHGMVSHYSAFDFEGAKDCPQCVGNGEVWRTPKGRYVQYPGGPFC